MMAYSVLPLELAPEANRVWQRLADACPDAWFWHTWANMQFNFVASQKSDVRNLSFFVMRDGQAVGLVPLMVNRTTAGEWSGWEASYYGAPLPWPAFLAELPDFAAAEQFALTELETRAREAGAERIRLRLEPPLPAPNERERLGRAVALRYLDSSYVSHFMAVNAETLANVRERYRRYVKKFALAYDMSIADGEAVTPALEETYFHLHVKDAGGQYRSRESYRFQGDLARYGEAFYVIARNRVAGAIAGMLLVSTYKKVAYDNSVAVDPDYQSEYVSHLLKWAAIKELLRRGVSHYELGLQSDLPSFMFVPCEKNRGISHFKEGWARDSTRRVVMVEKFLSTRYLREYMRAQTESLEKFFGLQ
jgi:Acetyltransferase (GNAT) domain